MVVEELKEVARRILCRQLWRTGPDRGHHRRHEVGDEVVGVPPVSEEDTERPLVIGFLQQGTCSAMEFQNFPEHVEVGAMEQGAAVLVDSIERMADVATIHPLPRGFQGQERKWYRGLTYLEDRVIPVINPGGFLTVEEFARLDQAAAVSIATQQLESAVQG